MSSTTPTDALPTSSTLYFGPWYRKSPMFESTLRAGCSAYDIYNHMYLPGYYDDPVTEYWALLNGVTLWDVGVERVVQISGPDAFELTNMMTCRDLTKCAVGQGKYVLITAPDGGIVNDPVLLRRAEDSFWLCLADSDVHLYALGIATGRGPGRRGVAAGRARRADPGTQGQGRHAQAGRRRGPGREVLLDAWTPRSTASRGDQPHRLDRRGRVRGLPHRLQPAAPTSGTRSWRPGAEHDIRPIAPCEARRIEAGIFNYNSDITLADNPFQVMGLERLVEEQEADYIGKAALERIRREGVTRRLVGIEMPGEPLAFEIAEVRPALHDGERGRPRDRPDLVAAAGARTSGTSGCRPSSASPAPSCRSRAPTVGWSTRPRRRSRSSTRPRRCPPPSPNAGRARRRWCRPRRPLVRPVAHHPGEPQRDPARVAGRRLHAVERDLDDQLGPHEHLPLVARLLQRQQLLGLPAQHRVGQALERLAQHHEAAGRVARAEVQVRQPALAPAVPPLGREHDQVEGVHRLDLQPADAAPARGVRRVERLDHHALVAAGDRVGEERAGHRRRRR